MSIETETVRRELKADVLALAGRLDRMELDLLAELRRERDVRADLRVELDRVRAERDEARRDLVAAMRTIEEGARG